ncbi:MAG: hypothetical protein ABGZ35_29990, partial [Planctomycetaceae bacterium]
MGTFIWAIVATVVAVVLLAVLLFGDIGFDRPGRFGMSYGHGILLSALYVIALISGLACSYVKRKWKATFPQLLMPLLLVAYTFWPGPHYPAPHYDASEYQHLVGKTRTEVETQLSSRNAVYGMQADDTGETEFVLYNGMTVHYSMDGVVVKIESDAF